jgi:hypothetical protein
MQFEKKCFEALAVAVGHFCAITCYYLYLYRLNRYGLWQRVNIQEWFLFI